MRVGASCLKSMASSPSRTCSVTSRARWIAFRSSGTLWRMVGSRAPVKVRLFREQRAKVHLLFLKRSGRVRTFAHRLGALRPGGYVLLGLCTLLPIGGSGTGSRITVHTVHGKDLHGTCTNPVA